MKPDDKQLPLFEFDPDSIPTAHPASTTRDADDCEFSKYIVYVDESGDHSLESIDRKYPIFVLAFCIFHKRHYSEAIVPALEKFKFNYFGHDQIVLHETDIRKERGVFNIFRSREEKQRFINELTDIIDYSNFILISCVIRKQALSEQNETSTNPYHIALGACIEELYQFLKEKQQHQKKTHVVVECRGKKEDNELELEFRRICDENRFSRNLPFEILFSDKKTMSSGLQLADLVARPIGLKTLKPEQENRAFDVLTGKFFCHGGRELAGQDYEGIGMKIIPASESEKPR
jgi:hypothetical protein